MKENLKAISKLQSLVKQGKKTIEKDELIKLGIDLSNDKIKLRNIEIKKDLFGMWSISIIDKKADLDGNMISENNKLLKRIQNLYESGETTISFTDLISEFNIYTSATDLNIGNFNLNSLLRLSVYDISLIDKNKNISGKWIDKSVDNKKVKEVLLKFKFTSEMLKLSEVQLNKELETHFKQYFETVKKGDSTNQGLVDLNIGNGQYVIELKLSREAKKSDQADRAVGQVERYKEHFSDKFMLVIFGEESDRSEKCINLISKKVKDSGGIYQYITPS
jgi:hypothetical protein